MSSNASLTTISDCVQPALLGIGAVAHQQQHAAPREFRDLGVVGLFAVNRRVVELVVAAVDDDPVRRVDAEADAVRDAVGDVIAFDLERADLKIVARLEDVDRRLVEQPRIAQLDFEQRGGQRRRVKRHFAQRIDDVRDRAGMVFVTMCVEDAVNGQVFAFGR